MSAENPGQGPAPTEQTPRDAMNASVDAARQATQALEGGYDKDYLYGINKKEELMQVGYEGPSIKTSKHFNSRVDARTETTGPNTSTDIHAYDVQDRMGDYAATSIRRYDNDHNLVYEHRFKSPETAQKFAAKIGEHVTKRALAATAGSERTAA